MAKRATAVDLGSHSVKVLVATAGKQGVAVLRFAGLPRGDSGAAAPLREASVPVVGATVGLAGRDMTLRYSQVPPTPDWQLRNLMDLEIQDLAQQSGGALSADYNLLPAAEGAEVDTVLLALAKDESLERLEGEVAAAGGSVDAFVPNCTALYNAYLKCGPVDPDAVVCLVNIGHQTMDLAIVRGTDLLFARNLSSGTKALDDAIAATFNVGARKAEALKKDLLDLDPQSRGRFASGQAEKVTMAAMAAAGSIPAAIQSSLSFCKAQTRLGELRIDKVLVCGGGSRLRGLRSLLREQLRCPVEHFDPFATADLSALPPDDAEQLEAMRHEAVVALGLALGRVDDTLYSLEILPEAVRRRQLFRQRTVWNIAAALVIVGLLVLQVDWRRREVDAAAAAASTLKRRISAVNAVHSEATQLVEDNKVLRALVDHLRQQALPLHGLLRTQRAIIANLPPQLWIEKLDLQPSGPARQGQPRGPVLVVEAAGKELNGVEVSRVVVDFVRDFKSDPGMAGMAAPVMQPLPSQTSASRFKITVELAGGD